MDNIYSKIAKEVNKHSKQRTCFVFGQDDSPSDVDYYFKTGSLSLDAILGNGLPNKRIIEISGAEGSGKSTLLMNLIAKAQKAGIYTILFEPEGSNLGDRLEQMGIIKEKLFILDVDCIEDFFDSMQKTIEEIKKHDSDARILVGWDSLASTMSRVQFEGDYDTANIASVARVMSNSIRKINRIISKCNVIFVVINQVREKIGIIFGDKEITPGGRALKFYCCIRLRLSIAEKIKDGSGNIIGIKTRITTVKNKVASPWKSCVVVIDFNNGIKNLDSIVASLKECNSSVFNFGDKIYKGEQLKKLLKDSKEAREKAINIIRNGKQSK